MEELTELANLLSKETNNKIDNFLDTLDSLTEEFTDKELEYNKERLSIRYANILHERDISTLSKKASVLQLSISDVDLSEMLS